MDALTLDDHQLVGLLLFLGALVASVALPYLSARGVQRCKRRVYGPESLADKLIVFDLLVAGATGQLVVVAVNVFDNVRAFQDGFLPVGQAWDYAIWADHELRARCALLVALIALPFLVAELLRSLHRSGRLTRRAISGWTGVGLAVLTAVLLANVFMRWTLWILSS